jgi:hypothetical protein
MTKSTIIAETISTIFNPLVVLVPVPFFLVYESTHNFFLAIFWMIISVAFIFAFFMSVLIGIKLGIISNLDISKREERPRAFLVAIILSLIYLLTLYFYKAPMIMFAGVLALVAGIVILGIANTFTKVSWHLAVFSAFATFLVLIEGWVFLFGFAFAPPLIWARIKTKNHTLRQTLLGAGLGILTTVVIYIILKYIIRYG